MDSDQAWQNVGADLNPNFLTLWWYSWKYFSKSWFWKKSADDKKEWKKVPRMQRVKRQYVGTTYGYSAGRPQCTEI